MNLITNLFAIEWRKITRLRSVQLIFLLYTISVPAWMWFYVYFTSDKPKLGIILPNGKTFASFPDVWGFVTWSASFFNIFLGVIVIILTTNEIQFRTLKQNIIDGLSKVQMIWSRMLVIILVSIVVLIYTACVALVSASFYDSYDFYENSHWLFIYGFQTICYLAVAFLIAILLKKPAVSILLFVCYFPAEKIASKLLPIGWSNYLPFQAFARLTPFPFERIERATSSAEDLTAWHMPIVPTIGYCLALIVLIYGLTFWLLNKRDL